MKDTLNILNESNNGQATASEVFSPARRVFEQSNAFDFVSGTTKIERSADVAYIFKKLEDKAVENAFMVLVKDGEPTIIHLSTGTATTTLIDHKAILVAADKINPDKVYFVHNHPTGELTASSNDIKVHQDLQSFFGDKMQPSIIININSGKFATYNEDGNLAEYLPQELPQGDVQIPLNLYSFSKLVFEKGYNPEKDFRISNGADVAEFVSSHRTGERNKMSFLVRRADGNVGANIFLPYTEISLDNVEQISADIASKAMALEAGISVIPYGSFSGVHLLDTLSKKIKEKSFDNIKMIDAVYVDNEKGLFASWFENGGFANAVPTADDFLTTPAFVSEQETPYEQLDIEIEKANQHFNAELKNEKHVGVYHLGKPLGILKNSGLKNGEIVITQKTLNEHLEKHKLKKDDLIGLAKAIQSPIFIYQHGKKAPATIIVTEMETTDKRKISIAVRMNNKGKNLEINEVSSVHGKEIIAEIERLSRIPKRDLEGLIKYGNEKALAWLSVPSEGTYITNQELNDTAKLIKNLITTKFLDKKNQNILNENEVEYKRINKNAMETKNTQTTEQKLAKNLAPEQFEEFKEILMSSEYMARFGYDNDILGWRWAMDAINEATTPQEVSDNLNKALGYDEEDFIDAEDLQKYIAQAKENVDQSPSLEEMIGNYFYGNENSNNIVMELGLDLDSAAAEEVHIRLESYKEDYDQTVTMADYDRKRAEQNQMIDSASKTVRSIAAQENLNVSNAIDEALTEKNNTNLKNLNTMETKNKNTEENVQQPQTAVEQPMSDAPKAENGEKVNPDATDEMSSGIPNLRVNENESPFENLGKNFVDTYNKIVAERKVPKSQIDQLCELLQKQGYPLAQMAENGDLTKLVNSQKTDELYDFPKTFKNDKGETVNHNSQARVSVKISPEGAISIKTHELIKNPKFEKYFNHEFTPKQKESLKKYGNAGEVIPIIFPGNKEATHVLITVDKKTNQLVSRNPQKINVSDQFLGVPISPEQKQEIKDGKMVQLNGMISSKGNEINAPVYYDADTRGLTIHFNEANKRKNLSLPGYNTATDEQMQALAKGEVINLTKAGTEETFDSRYVRKNPERGDLDFCKTGEFKMPTHLMNKEQKKDFDAGKTFKMDNLIGSNGQTYTSNVRKNSTTGRVETSQDGTFTKKTTKAETKQTNNFKKFAKKGASAKVGM